MKKIKSRALKIAIASLVIPAAPALATPVTLSDTQSINQVLNGNSTNLNFNIGSLLSSQGLSPTDVLSGNLTVYGYSNVDYRVQSQPYGGYYQASISSRSTPRTGSYSHSHSWSWSSHTHYYTYYQNVADRNYRRSHYTTYTDNVADVMQVSAGGSTASDSANTVYSNTTYRGSNNDPTKGSYYSGYRYYSTQEYNRYSALYGQLQVSLTLDALALQDISADGILDFGVDARLGQFRLTSARLSITAEKKQVSSIPEPSTLSLIGLAVALAAGGGMRRRKRKES